LTGLFCRQLVPVDRLGRNSGLILQWADPLSARVIRDGDRHLTDVVLVIRFGKLVADARTVRIRKAAGLAFGRYESGIDRDAREILAFKSEKKVVERALEMIRALSFGAHEGLPRPLSQDR